MNLKNRLLMFIYKDDYLEFYFLDSILDVFKDGLPRTDIPVNPNLKWAKNRVFEYLHGNKFIETHGDGYRITSLGRMHISKGGCTDEFIRHKLSRLSFWLSIVATTISIVAFFIAISK